MAICRKCSRTIGAYPGADTKCGRFYTTLIVARRMARRQRRAFSGGRFRISLKPCYLISRPYLNRGGEDTKSHYIIEVIECPALSGYPHCSPQQCRYLERRQPGDGLIATLVDAPMIVRPVFLAHFLHAP